MTSMLLEPTVNSKSTSDLTWQEDDHTIHHLNWEKRGWDTIGRDAGTTDVKLDCHRQSWADGHSPDRAVGTVDGPSSLSTVFHGLPGELLSPATPPLPFSFLLFSLLQAAVLTSPNSVVKVLGLFSTCTQDFVGLSELISKYHPSSQMRPCSQAPHPGLLTLGALACSTWLLDI